MRYRVIRHNGIDSIRYPGQEHVASFNNAEHAIAFCVNALDSSCYVVDCFDDTIIARG